MSEKVKLTKEQAKHIDGFIDAHNKGLLPSSLTVSLSLLADAIKYGYEVEPEFKVGDWVVNLLSNEVGQVDRVEKLQSVASNKDRVIVESIICYPDYLRHATPEEIAEEKERRWWKKHGREVWELRKGDLLINEYHNVHEVTGYDYSGKKIYYLDYVTEYLSDIKNKYKVVCFAENRLDLARKVLERDTNGS